MNEVISILSYCRAKGISIAIDDTGENIRISGNVKALSDSEKEQLKHNKSAILSFLKTAALTAYKPIVPVREQSCYPLSSLQKSLWILSQFEGGNAAYNIPMTVLFEGELDCALLEKAFRSLITRHEILRTVFREDETGEVKQYIMRPEETGFNIGITDLRSEKNVVSAIKEVSAYEFDLANGPLLKVVLFQLADNQWVFACVMHHIISDGWSMDILVNELLLLYNSGIAVLPPLNIQYKDFSSWQHQQLENGALEADRTYWLQQFGEEIPVLELPLDKPRPVIKTYKGSSISKSLTATLSQEIKILAAKEGATLFVTLLAAVYTLLYRYTEQEDIVIGTPVAGRDQSELQGLLGCYVNTLALRTKFSAEDDFLSLLNRVKHVIYEGHKHQAYPFDKLTEELNLPPHAGRNALFDVMVTLKDTAINYKKEISNLGKLSVTPYEAGERLYSKFDLTFDFTIVNEEIQLRVVYNTDIYSDATIARLQQHFEQLISAIVAHPYMAVGDLDYLSAEEKHLLLDTFNNTSATYPTDKIVTTLFEEQVINTPDRTALVFEGKEITYQALNELANQLGAYLKKNYNIQREEPVPIKLARSEWIVISLLAILKAGGAYLPLDPDHPQERIDYIRKDSGCRVLIDEALLNNFSNEQARYGKENLPQVNTSADLAYVIYTSGSTGQPKGVMITHQSLVHYLFAIRKKYGLADSENVLQAANFAFDAATEQLFISLVSGATIYLPGKAVAADPAELSMFIAQNNITHLHAVPDLLKQLNLEGVHTLKRIIAAGDVFPVSLLHTTPENTRLYNKYGPTEATISATIFDATNYAGDGQHVPIGSPLDNVQVYITDSRGQLVPTGIPGEICIAGAGLANGYLNNPALTAETFIDHPFKPGGKIYKTKDLGKWLPDGNIVFIGRKDHQVKIRGYRIESGEIEYALQRHPAIHTAIVQLFTNSSGEKYLAAYLTTDQPLDVPGIREHLKQLLPLYMLPDYFVVLDVFPLTSSGKVDRKRLPAPEGIAIASTVPYVAAANETEKKLVNIWEEILDRERISVKDNFFEIGGHSLKATRLSSLIHKTFDVKLGLNELFTHAVLEEQAALIAKGTRTSFVNIRPVAQQEYYPLSSAQKRLFFLQELAPNSTGYNMPVVSYLGMQADGARIEAAFKQLIARHESFRTSFEKTDGIALQHVHANVPFSLDKHTCTATELKDYLESYIRPFDLTHAPLLRSSLVEVKDHGYVWVVDLHHIISDGTSHQVLIDDFIQLYEGKVLPDLQLQYRDFSSWQNNMLESKELESQQVYWLSRLSGNLPRLNLPADRPRPASFSFEGDMYAFSLGTALTTKIRALGRQYRGTLQMTLLSVLNVLLHKYTGQDDMIIGCGIAGRRHPDLERIVGMFVNTLAIRTAPQGNKSFDSFYREVITACLAAYEHQDLQFEDLVDMLKLRRDPSVNPVFDITLVVQNFTPSKTDRSVLLGNQQEAAVIANQWKGTRTSKFDMSWFVLEQEDDIAIHLEYYSAIYDRTTIERLVTHFMRVLETVLHNPHISLSRINMLSAEEKEILLSQYVNNIQSTPTHLVFHELFEQQCLSTPDHIAIQNNGESLTYAALNEKAGQLAYFLLHKTDLQRGDAVGVLLSRSQELIVAILAISKAGGVYVPLDNKDPENRILYILEDAGIDILLTGKDQIEFANRLQWRRKGVKHLVCLDTEDVYSERGKIRNDLMRKDLWDLVGNTATDEISGGGWMSSYTGEYLSEMEMKEYSENAFLKLKDLLHKDMKVLEIGCSSGLTLSQIAPYVGHYHGTDLSSTILENTGKMVQEKGWSNVTLSCLPAHETDLLEDEEFDLVIINSVIQSFDGHNYLRDVLTKTIAKMKTSGWLYIGDIMDEARRQALIDDLTAFKHANQGKGYLTKTDMSAELFVSREYLNDLVLDNMGIAAVNSSDKIFTIHNELTDFRYDALLKIEKQAIAKEGTRNRYQHDLRNISANNIYIHRQQVTGTDLLYIAYVSGSTGPKGVMITHENLVTFFEKCKTLFRPAHDIIMPAITINTFDTSLFETFYPLFSGGVIIIPDQEQVKGTIALTRQLQQVNTFFAVPAQMALICEHINTTGTKGKYGQLKNIFTGGDVISPRLLKMMRKAFPQADIHTFYGPVETTISIATKEYSTKEESIFKNTLIGEPNAAIYISDEYQELVPVGVIGEICVAGPSLARGYLHQDELTAASFVKNPFSDGARIYKTGDLGRWLPDGNIEYLGRTDGQVKIEGYRVELTEIENAILATQELTAAAVIIRTNTFGEKELVAYIVAEATVSIADLRTYLVKQLPAYMIPYHFVQLDQLPLNATGKVNKNALPDLAGLSIGVEYIPARNETEAKLVSIWEEILGRTEISIKDNFFEIGGHSLKATRLSSFVHKVFDVKIPLKDLFLNPVLEQQAAMIAAAVSDSFTAIPQLEEQSAYLLSSSQRRLWLSGQQEQISIAYNMPSVYMLEGKLDLSALEHAFNTIINKHEILRTVFREDEQGEVRQYILAIADTRFTIIHKDLRKETQQEDTVVRLIHETVRKPFNLTEGPLLRVALYQLSDESWVLCCVMHHIISDGWSMKILMNEWMHFYDAYTTGKEEQLLPLRIQYKDYAAWQQAQLRDGVLTQHKEYWLKQLGGEIPVLQLPNDYLRPAVKTYNGRAVEKKIDLSAARALNEFCQEQGGTLFMGLLAAVNALFYRYSNQQDIIIGTPIAGREHADMEDQIGFYLNTLALRTQFSGADNFRELFSNVKQVTLDAYEHQVFPFDELIEELDIEYDASRSLLFDVMLVLQNTMESQMFEAQYLHNLTVSGYPKVEVLSSKFDLVFNFVESEDGLTLTLVYNNDIYKENTIVRLADHLTRLLSAVIAHPDQAIEETDYLSAQEKNTLLLNFNDTWTDYEQERTIVHLFEEQVMKHPDHIALAYGGNSLSYQELNQKANQLAAYLKDNYNVHPNDLIGVQLERTEWLIIAILGVFKSGAAYVPIDPAYPQDRIDYMVADSQCRVVIDEVLLQEIKAVADKYNSDNIAGINTSTDLAYIIYTSGSTGQPKGVLVQHTNLSHFFAHTLHYYSAGEPLIQPFIASHAFDISIFQLFTPLLSGGTSVLVSKEQLGDMDRFIAVLKAIDTLDTVPGVYNLLVSHIMENNLMADFKHIKRVFIGGDAIPDILLQRLAKIFSSAAIIVTYGPTETTIFCTHIIYKPGAVRPDTRGAVIGYPGSRTNICILDERQQLMPVGTIGEICISGPGVTKGYLNQPRLSEEKFLPHPFKENERIYRTGDLGKWLPDGTIEFAGRKDGQVKVRGYRIELGEIEARMREHNSIADAVVIAAAIKEEDKSLIGYFVKKRSIQVWPSISEYLGYNDLAYYAMNADELRAGSYKKAIELLVKDKVVMDVGTGPEAILAQHCLAAGAKKVYAVEILEEIYEKAKEKIESLGLQDRIILILGNIMDITLPEQVDYCVCALVGNMGSSDGCIPIMNAARRFVKDPACMIPYRSVTKIAAINLAEEGVNYGFTETGVYYTENIFSKIGAPFDMRVGLQHVEGRHLISTQDIFEDLDLTTYLSLNQERDISLQITTDSDISGFLIWLNLHTAPNIVNDVFLSQKSFLPIYFPVFGPGVQVHKGDMIRAKVWTKTAEGHIYPDYGITGYLERAGKESIPFTYTSERLPGVFGHNNFYQQVFPGGQLQLTPSFSAQDLQEHLHQHLPEYMVPSVLLQLERLPLTSNGKIDRRALLETAEAEAGHSVAYVAPRNETEERLVAMWQEILGKEKIGIHDNFFELGGHSLKATRFIMRVKKEFKIRIDLRNVFLEPTIEGLANKISTDTWLQAAPVGDDNEYFDEIKI